MTIDVPADELRQLRLDFLGELDEKITLIRRHGESLTSRNRFKTAYPVLLYLAHQIRGSGGTIGFPRISELGATLASRLDAFLDDSAPRPEPKELAVGVLEIAGQLSSEVKSAGEQLAIVRG